MRSLVVATISTLLLSGSAIAADPVFSGPQVGEKLVPFKVKGVYDKQAGKELDFVVSADGKAMVLVFVHKLTRPSAAVTRVLMNYVASRKKDGLYGAIAWLSDDVTATEAQLKRARRAMPKKTPIGISVDGQEGPGAYGLNRKVTLTVLVAKENKVTANFAIVQPSMQADLPKIIKEIVKLVGGKVPTLKELGAVRKRPDAKKKRRGTPLDPELAGKLRELIQKEASAKDVEKAAEELEKLFKKKPALGRTVASIVQLKVKAGQFESLGTPKAREYLKKWAKEYASSRKAEPKKKSDKPMEKDAAKSKEKKTQDKSAE